MKGWEQGQRVGVGWFGGNCDWCDPCRRGDFILCQNVGVPGVTFDGGYADYVVVKSNALAAIPKGLAAVDAAPLLCTGITTYNALRTSGAVGGDTVAILGVGGLGHLAVQFAAKLGFRTVAIARGAEKEALAQELASTSTSTATPAIRPRRCRRSAGRRWFSRRSPAAAPTARSSVASARPAS